MLQRYFGGRRMLSSAALNPRIINERLPHDGASDISSEDSWEIVGERNGINADEERTVFARSMRLAPRTLEMFDRHGYTEWNSPNGGGIVQTLQMGRSLWDRIGVPIGDQERLSIGLQRYLNGTFWNHYALPGGSLRHGIPVLVQAQAPEPNSNRASADEESELQNGDGALQPRQASSGDAAGAIVRTVSILGFGLLAFLLAPVAVVAVSAFFSLFASAAPVAAVAVGDCVDGETKITTADRQQVPIRSLKPKDLVLSYYKGKFRVVSVCKVTRNIVSSSNLCRLRFKNAKHIVATRNHPFYSCGKKWCAALPEHKFVDKLTVGQKLVKTTGEEAEVVAIETFGNGQHEVFNLVVAGHGTFFANGILCHSGCWVDWNMNKENVRQNIG